MSRQPESRTQKRIRERLEAEFGGWWRKIHGGPYQAAGIPDIVGLVLHPKLLVGIFCAFEVKEPGKVATKLQLHNLKLIREAGGIACVVETPKEALDAIRSALA